MVTTMIGIVFVAACAAWPAGVFAATIMSTFKRTSSPANSENRSVLPCPQRHSIVMFCFST